MRSNRAYRSQQSERRVRLHEPCERRPTPGYETKNIDRPKKGSLFSLFVLVTTSTAILTVLLCIIRFAIQESRTTYQFSKDLITTQLVSNLYGSNLSPSLQAHSLEARSQFLEKLLSKQSSKLNSEIVFVRDLITKQLANKVNSAELAYSIVSEAFRANYDPLFVAAIIKSESMFRHKVVSNRGARGLMQIMPDTGKFISRERNIKWDGEMGLHDPSYNVRMGIAYLKHLEHRYAGNKERMLIAYNWGPANLEQSLKGGTSAPSSSVTYARTIISNHRKWLKDLALKNQSAGAGAKDSFS